MKKIFLLGALLISLSVVAQLPSSTKSLLSKRKAVLEKALKDPKTTDNKKAQLRALIKGIDYKLTESAKAKQKVKPKK